MRSREPVWTRIRLVAAGLIGGLVGIGPALATPASAPIQIEGRPGINSMTLEFVCLLPLDGIELEIYGVDGLKVRSPVPTILPPCRAYERIPVPVRWERGDGRNHLVVNARVSGPPPGAVSQRVIRLDGRQLVKAAIPYVLAGLLSITVLGASALRLPAIRRRMRHASGGPAGVLGSRKLRIAAIAWLAIVVPLCAFLGWYALR